MDNESLETFKEWLAQYDLKEKYQSLNELVKNEDDLELWKEKGFDWDGVFDLDKSSVNINFLRDYIQRRKLSINI